MRRDRTIQFTALGLMLVFLTVQGVLSTQLAASVGRNRLVFADRAEAGDPPEVALGIAMGAFRGVFVNFLWIRANTLKEQGKYYESVDLARTITRLQPRFPRVWVFHAWNLAYNISVATQTPQERWQWVQSGITLLRRDGIPNNPGSILLYKELAWIYLHKVQGYMDDAHRYYKRMHAREWTIVMGMPPKVPFGERTEPDALKNLYIERWLTPIAEAPDTLDEVYAQQPLARELVARIRDEAGLSLNRQLLEYAEEVRSYVLLAGAGVPLPPGFADDGLVRVLTDQRYAQAGPVLIRHLRKRVLLDDYNMDPRTMIRYTQKYGPLDWRHPAAHAVYWSARGSEEALFRVTEANRKDFDFLNTDRITIQAIQELFRSGWVQYDIVNPAFMRNLPHADFIPIYPKLLDELAARSDFDTPTRVYSFYAAGNENHIKDSIRFLYRRGDLKAAEEYYRYLRTWPGLNTHNPELQGKITVPLREFVVNEIVEDARETNPTVAMQEIAGALMSAFVAGLLGGDEQQFRSNIEYARMFHDRYQQEQGSVRTVVTGQEGRMAFPPFDQMAATFLAGLVEEAGIPQGPVMYRRAPADLQGRAYVLLERTNLRAMVDQMATQGQPPFDVWFPPPNNGDERTLQMYRTLMLGEAGQVAPSTPDAGRIEQR